MFDELSAPIVLDTRRTNHSRKKHTSDPRNCSKPTPLSCGIVANAFHLLPTQNSPSIGPVDLLPYLPVPNELNVRTRPVLPSDAQTQFQSPDPATSEYFVVVVVDGGFELPEGHLDPVVETVAEESFCWF